MPSSIQSDVIEDFIYLFCRWFTWSCLQRCRLRGMGGVAPCQGFLQFYRMRILEVVNPAAFVRNPFQRVLVLKTNRFVIRWSCFCLSSTVLEKLYWEDIDLLWRQSYGSGSTLTSLDLVSGFSLTNWVSFSFLSSLCSTALFSNKILCISAVELRQKMLGVAVQGIRVLWTGVGAQLARDVPFSAICWATLEPVSPHILYRPIFYSLLQVRCNL